MDKTQGDGEDSCQGEDKLSDDKERKDRIQVQNEIFTMV